MPTIEELRKKRRATAQKDVLAGFPEGYTGNWNADGSMTASDQIGTIYVRIGATTPADKRPATRVNNSRVDTANNLPVILWKPGRTWEVFALNTERAKAQFGALIGNAATPRRVGDKVQETTPGRNLKPGRVRVWTPGTLELNAEAFPYTDSSGASKLWTPEVTNTLDVSSHVPASGLGRWVRIALDPDATTPVLAAFSGSTMSALLYQPTGDGWEAIAVTDGFIPLDSVWLEAGDTTVPNDTRYRFARLLFDKAGEIPGGGSGSFDADTIMTDANFDVMVDALGNVMGAA